MSRPIRIEFPDALYHVTARGDRREAIFEDDQDRSTFLVTLEQVINQFNWTCYAWCLMDNHYHLLIQTPDGNLSKGMRQLNGVYTQASNRRHQRVGHLFQGRFKAILVDKDAYLLELARYIVLNPVRAGRVKKPNDWAWSSYRASMGLEPAPPWLAEDGLLAMFAKRRSSAQQRYAQFVSEGIKVGSPWAHLKGQVFLGDERFVTRMQAHIQTGKDDVQIPRAQRRPEPPPLAEIAERAPDRNAAIVAAHATGGYSYQQIADYFGVHFTTVGRIVRGDGCGRRMLC
ncbi:MAG: addiction module toxin RelE [Hydrogenophilales bacterium CG03_land_8_20_14_0_80_62_28]|nr:MAG: addiction module toxin RelE [Hydrogenophilaceae bacterium CG1_02_62_390]PIV23990.1 MAG: addiction module toxin RelE [Hydrogenophilales bacterium CG03_land_8_20_14_0_80_62_28]PIW38369.1 MAG: addiction module toxin RelE [Hydrogenophilales bacterium CG15_BIG_FIL_POST_REV_8_21_14_020_62_31]PIW71934.1 MAG: addiction module toxin RelE [Hydrogenophilales bacterium CG12_big_fil_rev_8_21_14_0_65_61_21]PIX02486.1 MAG: addiction module toxin RelE [Hydrogenophilales bacterium CG_4_8_14_3_um_filter_